MDPIILIPIAIGIVSAVVAYLLGQKFGGKPVAIGLGVIAMLAAVLYGAASQATGYDGIAFIILLIFGTGPAAAGFLGGGLLGCFKGAQTPAPL